MHKKITAELVSLAHSILQLENKDDVLTLHKKSQEIYEKLTVLKFVNENISNSIFSDEAPIVSGKVKETTVESPIIAFEAQEIIGKSSEIIEEFDAAIEFIATIEEVEETDTIVVSVTEEQQEENLIVEEIIEEVLPVNAMHELDDEELVIFEIEEAIEQDEAIKAPSLRLNFEDEFRDAVSADIAANLFEKVTKASPIIEKQIVEEVKKKSLNDALYSTNIQVGLNDRIAFVKHLFDGSQEDFNRVLSQLNSFKSANEAVTFIKEFVKPDYNWGTKGEYEERFLTIIERKFS